MGKASQWAGWFFLLAWCLDGAVGLATRIFWPATDPALVRWSTPAGLGRQLGAAATGAGMLLPVVGLLLARRPRWRWPLTYSLVLGAVLLSALQVGWLP